MSDLDYADIETGYHFFKAFANYYSNDVCDNDLKNIEALAKALGYDCNRFIEDLFELNDTFNKLYDEILRRKEDE